jgi:hypothetical protein
MTSLSPDTRKSIQEQARATIMHGRHGGEPDLWLAIRARLFDDDQLRVMAFNQNAEQFVAVQECWAQAVGAIAADAVRAAFRDTERAVRAEMLAAVAAEDEAAQRAKEGPQ